MSSRGNFKMVAVVCKCCGKVTELYPDEYALLEEAKDRELDESEMIYCDYCDEPLEI